MTPSVTDVRTHLNQAVRPCAAVESSEWFVFLFVIPAKAGIAVAVTKGWREGWLRC
jgi:hypothetical protein